MKFNVTLNDIVKNDYLSVLTRLWHSGGVNAFLENNRIRLVYQGCEVVKPFIFPENYLLIEDKIEMMSKFIGVLFEGIIELKKCYEQTVEEFNKKIDKKVEIMDNFLYELYEAKYGEKRIDDKY